MRVAVIAACLGMIAVPAVAQMPDPSQLLQGLLSGNRNNDQPVRDAFERGYQRGRQDQERADASRYGRPGPGGPPPGYRGADQGQYVPPGPSPYGR